MRITGSLFCVAAIFAIGLSTGSRALAQPDTAMCQAYSGPTAGACRAATTQACNILSTSQACRNLAVLFESAAGTLPPWLDIEGPSLACTSPAHGGVVDESPGAQIDFQGTATDPSGLSELLVNGSPVAVDGAGNFATPLTGDWGMNFVTLAATDGVGNAAARTCAFLLSDTWVPDGETLASSISFRARGSVFDDSNRNDPLDSFADIGHTVINSNGLQSNLRTQLTVANPLKDARCDHEDFLGFCVYSAEVTYLDLFLPGPSDFDLSLVSGGVRSVSTVRNLRVRVRVEGVALYIPYEVSGWVIFDEVSTTMNSNLMLISGSPRLLVQSGSIGSTSDAIRTEIDGFGTIGDALVNTVIGVFNGPLRHQVVNTVESFVADEINNIFDDIFDGLGVHNLTTQLSVPLLDEATELGIGFGTSFSTMNVTSSRMLTSLGTQFSSVPGHARPTLGAPIPPGGRLLELLAGGPLAVAVHDGLLDQVLHALWRGGYFDVGLTGGDLGGLVPDGVALDFETLLPPAARLRGDGRLEIAIGAAEGQLEYPGFLPEAVAVSTAARGSCLPTLLGAVIRLEQCQVEELHLSFGPNTVDPLTQASLESFYTDIFNEILATTAGDFLPDFPIPGFELPQTLTVYGLPGGDEMGLRNPQLILDGDHVVLEGQFGVN